MCAVWDFFFLCSAVSSRIKVIMPGQWSRWQDEDRHFDSAMFVLGSKGLLTARVAPWRTFPQGFGAPAPPHGASARSPWKCRPGPSPASSSMPVFEGGCALLLLRVARISLRQALPSLPPVCPVGSRAPPSSPVCPHFSPLLPSLTSSTSCPRISISFSSLWHTWSQGSRRQPGLVRHKV